MLATCNNTKCCYIRHTQPWDKVTGKRRCYPMPKPLRTENAKTRPKTPKLFRSGLEKKKKTKKLLQARQQSPGAHRPALHLCLRGPGWGEGAYFPQVAAGRTQGAHGAHLEHPTVHTRGTPGTRGTPHTEHTTATPSPQRPPPALRQQAAPAPLYPPHTPCPAPPRRAPPHRTQRPRARASAFDEAAGRAGRGKGEGRRSAHAPRPARAQLGSEPGRGAGLGSCQRRGAGRA